jgi:type I restriction enzyme M protein
MRRKLIEADLIECVLGLGPYLFYNSPMEACIVICRTAKPKARRGNILFINAVGEVTRERAQSFLTDSHIERIVAAYRAFQDEPGFACVASREEIRAKDGNLSIPLYVAGPSSVPEIREEATTPYTLNGINGLDRLSDALAAWLESSGKVRELLKTILEEKP